MQHIIYNYCDTNGSSLRGLAQRRQFITQAREPVSLDAQRRAHSSSAISVALMSMVRASTQHAHIGKCTWAGRSRQASEPLGDDVIEHRGAGGTIQHGPVRRLPGQPATRDVQLQRMGAKLAPAERARCGAAWMDEKKYYCQCRTCGRQTTWRCTRRRDCVCTPASHRRAAPCTPRTCRPRHSRSTRCKYTSEQHHAKMRVERRDP